MKWLKQQRKIPEHRLVLWLSGLLLTSCATLRAPRDIKVPAYASAYFAECVGKDGSVSFEVLENGKVQQIFDADWSADAKGDISLASYSPLGQTLFQLDYSTKSKAFRQTGSPAKFLEDLSIGSKSMLQIDGHDLGLRVDEIACILNHKLPQRWLKKIVDENLDEKKNDFLLIDSDRKIRLSFPKGSRGDLSWSGSIEWSLYWGLKTLKLDMKLLKNEQALVLRANQFENLDVRIISQEE